MPVECACLTCGKSFQTYQYRIDSGGGKYCSYKCYGQAKANSCKAQNNNNWKGGKIKCTCIVCGKEYFIIQAKIKNGGSKYCSQKCHYKARTKKVVRNCEYCGKEFTPHLSQTTRNWGRYCSKDCQNKAFSGSGNTSWLGGISFEPYCPQFNKRLKKKIREFWNNKCVICSATRSDKSHEKMMVHHVTYDKEILCNNEIPLFVTLCTSCHTKTNHGDRDEWELFFKYLIWGKSGESMRCFQ